MRIVLDAMGSDRAPGVDVAGAVRAARRFGQAGKVHVGGAQQKIEIILVGREDEIERELRRQLRRERRAEALRKAGGDWEEIARLVPSGLQLVTELLCDARELQVKVQAPTGNDLADGVIAGIVGHRGVGPIDLRCIADSERRVQVHYHIGLCRAALGALYVAIQGLPWMLKRRAREKEDKGERPQGPAGDKEEEPASPPPAERLRSEAKESE